MKLKHCIHNMAKSGLNFFKDLFWMGTPLFCLENGQNAVF